MSTTVTSAAPIRISAKTLAALAMPDPCRRCFWVRGKLGGAMPFAMFPGIFAVLDSYAKWMTHTHYDRHGSVPRYLACLGENLRPLPVPHHTRFFRDDEETGLRLSGMPDEILRRRDGAHLIVDYKTAKYSEGQDALLPLYEAQMNGYAWIAERCGFAPVVDLALVYMEPQLKDGSRLGLGELLLPSGFSMKFRAKVVPVPLRQEAIILPLLREARRLFDLQDPPEAGSRCRDCIRMGAVVKLLA